MQRLVNDVSEFHRVMDVPICRYPEFPNERRIDLRKDLIDEEYNELLISIANRDIVETADAMVDLIYVIVGAAIEFGIPLAEVWDEVQRANMAKQGGPTRADGKKLKPAGWTPPDVARIIEFHSRPPREE